MKLCRRHIFIDYVYNAKPYVKGIDETTGWLQRI